MNIMFLLIGVSMLAALFFLVLFIWAVKTGQFEDMFTPSVRVLFDDDAIKSTDIGEESLRSQKLEDRSQ
jgi:cbb3-type cytochrome oxidase maturation protein